MGRKVSWPCEERDDEELDKGDQKTWHLSSIFAFFEVHSSQTIPLDGAALSFQSFSMNEDQRNQVVKIHT